MEQDFMDLLKEQAETAALLADCPECEDDGKSRWHLDLANKELILRPCEACGRHGTVLPPVPQSFLERLGMASAELPQRAAFVMEPGAGGGVQGPVSG